MYISGQINQQKLHQLLHLLIISIYIYINGRFSSNKAADLCHHEHAEAHNVESICDLFQPDIAAALERDLRSSWTSEHWN